MYKPRRKVIILFCVLLSLLAVACYGLNAEAAASGAADREIYLTFDDGPSVSVTPRILDILKEYDVPATFFVVGELAIEHGDIIRRADAEGHTVAIHCYRHDYKYLYSSPENYYEDLMRARRALTKILPEFDCHVMRFPGGSFTLSGKYIEVVKKAGFSYVDWNCTNGDTEKEISTAEDSYDFAVSTAGNRVRLVMLMHDNKSVTASGLEKIILYFKENGYTFKKF